MNALTVKELYTLEETIAKDLFDKVTYPWEVLPNIGSFIRAFTGGFLGLLITGQELSIVAMLGFLVLCGVVVNNGIVFIDYANQLKERGYATREAIIETGRTRLRPILMTALTTILAMTTMALGIGTGSDMMQGMAIVTIGGLTYSTVLTLFVVPIMIEVTSRRKDRKKAKAEPAHE